MPIVDQLTIGQRKLIITDTDPTMPPGLQAALGSLASYTVGSVTKLYSKTGTTALGWSRIFSDNQVIPVLNGGTGQNVPIAPLYMAGAAPEYVTNVSFAIAEFYCQDRNNAFLISNSTLCTVRIDQTGLLGIAQSGTLTGTVGTGGVASTVVTGVGTAFLSQFRQGDVLATDAGNARILSVPGNGTLNLATALNIPPGSTFKRGGRAPNTYYYLYAISNGTASSYILTTRNYNGTDPVDDLPSGYIYFRQMAFYIQTDGSSLMIPFGVEEGWPYRPFIRRNAGSLIYSGGITGSWVTQNASQAVPPICGGIRIYTLITQSTALFFSLNAVAFGVMDVLSFGYASPGSPGGALPFTFPINPDGSFQTFQNTTPCTTQLVVMGGFVTKVYK